MNAPASIAAETALNRQKVALAMIKHSAEQQEALAHIIDEAARTAPTSGSKGGNLNTHA